MAETVGEQLATGIMPPDEYDDCYHMPPLMAGTHVVKLAYVTTTSPANMQ